MKSLLAIILVSFVFSNTVYADPDPFAYSPRTYDCTAKSLGWDSVGYFHLKHGRKNGLLINGKDVLFKDYTVEGEAKYDTVHHYKGNMSFSSAQKLILDWGLERGTLTGDVFLVSKNGSLSTYYCEIDWSPY